MAVLELTNQSLERDAIAPKLAKLKVLLDQRKVIWDKLSPEEKKRWVTSGKDPIMALAWDIWRYLKNNFYEGVENGG